MKRYYPFYMVLIVVLSSCFSGKHIVQKHLAIGSANNPAFLFISDIYLDSFSDSTPRGNDTGLGLWKFFFNKLDTILGGNETPQFILCTGDMAAHYSCKGNCYGREKLGNLQS